MAISEGSSGGYILGRPQGPSPTVAYRTHPTMSMASLLACLLVLAPAPTPAPVLAILYTYLMRAGAIMSILRINTARTTFLLLQLQQKFCLECENERSVWLWCFVCLNACLKNERNEQLTYLKQIPFISRLVWASQASKGTKRPLSGCNEENKLLHSRQSTCNNTRAKLTVWFWNKRANRARKTRATGEYGALQRPFSEQSTSFNGIELHVLQVENKR